MESTMQPARPIYTGVTGTVKSVGSPRHHLAMGMLFVKNRCGVVPCNGKKVEEVCENDRRLRDMGRFDFKMVDRSIDYVDK